MCGICGVVQVGGGTRDVIDSGDLLAMTDAMTHRGPDDRGVYQAPGVAIGVRRLAIVDVEGGHQPVENEDGTIVAAQNGELYNHLAIRTELERDGHRFRSGCDTDILPHVYERWGSEFPVHIHGKFAACVWDSARRRAVIARDRLGVKPLYWGRIGDLVVFASELRALIASGLIEIELDLEAVDGYLTLGYFAGVTTPIAGVHKLLPGHRLVIDPDGVHDETYWRYPLPDGTGPAKPIEEYADELRELLRVAVRRRLMSDVPLGAMLSGGLDSSLIVALMAGEMSTPVKTFSVGFVEDGRGNELADARSVAERFSTDHHELELSFTQAGIDLDELAWEIDEPVADLSAFGFLMLSSLAAEHVTVALAGQGADELFGGYRKHRVASALRGLGVGRMVLRPLAARARAGQTRARRTLAAAGAPNTGAMLLAMSGLLDPSLRRELYRGPLAEVRGDAALVSIVAAGGARRFRDPLAGLLYLDAQLALPEDFLLYFDRASMARSLEVRVPFLDHELVEWAARIPTRVKIRRLETKLVLKQAARGILPDSVIDKRKIGFFRAASHAWLVSQLRGELGERLVGSESPTADLLDVTTVKRLVDEQLAGDRSRTQLVIAIAMLELWLSSLRRSRTGATPVSR